MNTPKTVKTVGKLSRGQLREALDTVPIDSLFSPAVSKELTGKQKAFCKELAKGNTKAGAYRKAYNVTSKATMTSEPYKLAKNPVISNEVEAMKAAIAAQEYQTPAALRSLVIHSLVKVISDPDSKPGQITAAAKVLGTVTEVAAFTERKEVRTITSSETARAQVLEQLRTLVQGSAVDVAVIDRDADSLLAELANVGESETHPLPTPQDEDEESRTESHTIPHEQHPPSTNFPDDTPTLHVEDDPPMSS